MQIKIKSQFSEVKENSLYSPEGCENVRNTLLAFGFHLEKLDKSENQYDKRSTNVYKVIGNDDENCVLKEFANIEELLALADAHNVKLIYGNGEWTLFDDPYYFL